MSAWYDLPPVGRAQYLRFCAGRQDESAEYLSTLPGLHNMTRAIDARRKARKLRALALLFEASTAKTAGAVDTRGIGYGRLSREEEDKVVAEIEAEFEGVKA